ncbi:hypothetical protein [Ottowia sp.]|uniref:hypothetical protein n=1 Tax=Ottowia sp. TaxID=1898956 RepID=UPI0039E49EBE
MDLMDFVWHVAGFLAPALFVAAGLAALARVVERKWAPARVLLAQAAINFVVGLAVLLVGLAFTGHDGRMLTYAALVLACAASQAWLSRRG